MTNNSKLAMDSLPPLEEEQVDTSEKLTELAAKNTRIVQAIKEVKQTNGWSTLKTEIFDSLVSLLTKELESEAKKDNPDVQKLSRIAGQLKWAEKYADLDKLEKVFTDELQRLKQL